MICSMMRNDADVWLKQYTEDNRTIETLTAHVDHRPTLCIHTLIPKAQQGICNKHTLQ